MFLNRVKLFLFFYLQKKLLKSCCKATNGSQPAGNY